MTQEICIWVIAGISYIVVWLFGYILGHNTAVDRVHKKLGIVDSADFRESTKKLEDELKAKKPKGLNLSELESKLKSALEKETEESFTKFINDKRNCPNCQSICESNDFDVTPCLCCGYPKPYEYSNED